MDHDTDRFPFHKLPDEAVIAVDQFLEDFYNRFQNQYFAQIRRYYYQDPPNPHRCNDQMPLPLDDPLF